MQTFRKRKISLEDTLSESVQRPSVLAQHTLMPVDRGKTLGVAIVESDSADTTIVSLPWSEYVHRPDAALRYAALAEATVSRVIAVDYPGVSAGSMGLGKRSTRLRRGDYTAIAEAQWQAVPEFAERRNLERLRLVGYALGAAAATALAANAPNGVKIDEIVLSEAISRPLTVRQLVNSFSAEKDRWQQYLSQSPDWMPRGNMKQIARRPVAMACYGMSVCRPQLVENLVAARRHNTIHSETKLSVVSGSDSVISPEDGNDELAQALINEGFKRVEQTVLLGEAHGVIDDLPRYLESMRITLEQPHS